MGLTNKVYGRLGRVPHVLCIPVSFVTANQGTITIPFNKPITVKGIGACVTGVLGGTDAGTVQASNGSSMSGGLLSFPASSVVGYAPTLVSPTTNQEIAAGGNLSLVVAKTTSGGTANIYVQYEDS